MVVKFLGCVDYECDVIICEDYKFFVSVKYVVNLFVIFVVLLEWFL